LRKPSPGLAQEKVVINIPLPKGEGSREWKSTQSFSPWEKVVKEKFMINKSLDEGIKTGGKGNE